MPQKAWQSDLAPRATAIAAKINGTTGRNLRRTQVQKKLAKERVGCASANLLLAEAIFSFTRAGHVIATARWPSPFLVLLENHPEAIAASEPIARNAKFFWNFFTLATAIRSADVQRGGKVESHTNPKRKKKSRNSPRSKISRLGRGLARRKTSSRGGGSYAHPKRK